MSTKRPFDTVDSITVSTLTGNATLTASSSYYQRLDPGGASRDVTLPAEAAGLSFHILNAADAAENLVVKDDGGGTIVTISQNEGLVIASDGTTWHHMGITTVSIGAT